MMFLVMQYHCVESPDSSVSVVTRLWTGKPMNCDPMSVKDKSFFSPAKHVDRLWDPPQPPIKWVPRFFLRG